MRLPHDSSFYAGTDGRFDRLQNDLVTLGFSNPYKKYLVYYDSPSALTGDSVCGQGHENATQGGGEGYAEVYIAPNIKSEPTENGCGNIEFPDDRGGYSAVVAVHVDRQHISGLRKRRLLRDARVKHLDRAWSVKLR